MHNSPPGTDQACVDGKEMSAHRTGIDAYQDRGLYDRDKVDAGTQANEGRQEKFDAPFRFSQIGKSHSTFSPPKERFFNM